MKSVPEGWPRLSSAIYYEDAKRAIDWLCAAFGFEVRILVPAEDGSVQHSELIYGDAVIMVCESSKGLAKRFGVASRSPAALKGANTQNLMLYVDDVRSHCARARAEGATITAEPEVHDYGPEYWADRSYGALDLDGHLWWFSERLRNPPSSA